MGHVEHLANGHWAREEAEDEAIEDSTSNIWLAKSLGGKHGCGNKVTPTAVGSESFLATT